MNSLKILHFTTHLGGGIGSVILNWMKKDKSGNMHIIFSLDKNNNDEWRKVNDNFDNVAIYDDSYNDREFKRKIADRVEEADIVILHWWNHPLMYDLTINTHWPDCRMLMWNHVSGLYLPYIHSERLIRFPDYFLFTSPVSYECREIQNLPDHLKEKLDVVWSTIGIEDFEGLQHTPHEGFIVGFTGTADFAKLNSNFIRMCSDVNVPDIKFIVCSIDSQEHLKQEAMRLQVFDRFSFEGRVPHQDIASYLARFDVFGYPLQPQHFGTCEQALGEAMMAGCVPVVLNNPVERYIVKDNVTGIIAGTIGEYSRAIEFLYRNPDIRSRLAANARIEAKRLYDMQNTLDKWDAVFENTMRLEKRPHRWERDFEHKLTPHELYIESVGDYSGPFRAYIENKDRALIAHRIKEMFETNSIFYSDNKGSVIQYLRYFPDDAFLKEWSGLLRKGLGG